MGVIYILASAGVTPNFFGPTQLNGTAPTGANTAYGWGPAKTAVTTPYYRGRLGATGVSGTAAQAASYNASTSGPTPGTGSGTTTAGDSFVTGPFAGTFAATAWTFNWNIRASTAGAIGHVNMRVWKSANADGSSATQLLANTAGVTVTLSTTADVNSSISWSPGALTLNNEYLFFQVEWQETTAGSSNNDNVFFRAGTASITTPGFTQNGSATIAGASTITANNTFSANARIAGTGGDTNWISNPRAEGAVTGSPGTLPTNWWFYGSETAVTRTIIGTGIEDGIPYIDIQFSATATTSNAYFVALEPYTAIPSFKGQRWNNSCYFRLMAGSISNVTIYIVSMEIDASSGQLGSSGFANSPKPTGAALKTQRMSVSYLTTQAAIAYIVPSWYLDYGAVGAAFDFTLRIGGPQFEDAASSASNLILPPVGSPQVSHRGVEGLPSSRMLAVAAISSAPTITADGSNFFGGNATITGSATITADGTGGVAPSNKLVLSFTPGTPRADFAGYVGVRFTPSVDLTFNRIGLRSGGASDPPRRWVSVWDEADTTHPLVNTGVDLTGGVAGTFYYIDISPITLLAGHRYNLDAFVSNDGTTVWADIGATTLRSEATSVTTSAAGTPIQFPGFIGAADSQYYGVDLDYIAGVTYTRVSPINMWANNQPAPYVATASSVYPGGYEPAAAFDGNPQTMAHSGTDLVTQPYWIKIDLGSPTFVNQYKYQSRADGVYHQWKDWILEGSNDDATYYRVDTIVGELVFQASEWRTYVCDAPGTYRYYRWTVTASQATYADCASLELWSAIGPPSGAAVIAGAGAIAANTTVVNSATVLISGSATVAANGIKPTAGVDGAATITGQGGKTNWVSNPRAEGAVAGTPGTIPTNWWRIITDDGGIQTQIVGTGTENGIPYLDVRFFGTSSGTRNGYIFPVLPGSGIPVHTGYTPYFSCYMRAVAGTIPPTDITSGLVTRWKLSDGSGLDLSPSANTGVFHGGATPTTNGPIGNAAVFDGSSGYVSSTIVINIPYVSLSVWIKTGTTAGNQWICGFADGLGSSTTDKFLYIDSSGHPAFYIYSTGGPAVATGTVRIDDNNWHHVVATYTDSLLSVYVDGVLNATNPFIYGASYTGYSVPNIILGGYGAVNATMWTPGTFDDFRVYNRPITAAEVSTLYAASGGIGANFSVILYAYAGTSFITSYFGNYPSAQLNQPGGLSTRFSVNHVITTSGSPDNAIAAANIWFNAGAIDITVRFGGPQLELNSVTGLILPPVGSPGISTRGIEVQEQVIAIASLTTIAGQGGIAASTAISTTGATTIPGVGGKTNYIRNPRGEGAIVPGTSPTYWDVEADTGMTIDVVGRFVVNGIDVVRYHYYGTPPQTSSACFNLLFEYVGGPSPSIIEGMPDGQQYTRSFYLRLVAGSWTNVPPWVTYGHLWDNSITNLGVAQTTVAFPTGSDFVRIVDTLTATGGTGGPYKTSTYGLISTATSLTPFDVTFDIGGAQFELGPTLTSLIVPPVGVLAASTRAIEADSAVLKYATALVSGSATVGMNPALSIPTTATIAGVATVAATPKSLASGSVTISGIATIAATPKSPFSGSATIVGVATLTATPKGPIRASATIAGVATFTATPKTPISASAAITGTATIAATPTSLLRASTTTAGVATIAATPTQSVPATQTITNASTITATPTGSVAASATITNASTITANALRSVPATANIVGVATITATSIRSVPATANIAGAAIITATAIQGAAPGAQLTGVSGAGQVGFEIELVTKRLTGVSGAGQAGTPTGPRPYVVVTLHSDNAGVPGSQIAVLGNIYDSDVNAGLLATGGYSSLAYGALSGLRLQNIRLQLVPPISLSPGTRYWIKLTDAASGAATNLAWVAASDASGVGVAPEFWNKPSSSGANNTSVAYEMRVLSPAQEQGVSAVGFVGSLTLTYTRPPLSVVGVAGIGRAGTEGKLIAKTLIGRVATGQAGIEGKQVAKPLIGRVASGQVGILGKSIGKQLTGRFATGQAGIEGKQEAKPLIGRVASGQVGILGKSIGKQLTGRFATGQAGIEGKQEAKPLTGRVATGQVGILGKSIGKQLTGRFATGQVGSLTTTRTKQLIGVSGTGQAGIEGKLVAKLLVGRTASGQVGFISVQAGVSKTLQLTGVTATGQIGVLGKLIAKQLAGVTGIGQPGLETELVSKRPIGVSGTGQTGILGKSIGKQLIGVFGTGQAGIEGKQEAKPLTGRVATGQAGILGKSIGKQLIGVSGTGQAGIEGKQDAKPLTGRVATGQAGILGKLIAKPLIGVSGTGRAGTTSVQAGVSRTLQLTGVSATGQIGNLGKLVAKQLIGITGIGQVGILGKSIGKQLIGVSGTGQAGIEGKQEAKSLVGRVAIGQVGILGKSISKQLIGVSGVGQAGVEGKQAVKFALGIAASGQPGILGKLIAKQLTGRFATGQAGSLSISLSKTKQLIGVSGAGQVGVLSKLIAKQLTGISVTGQAGIFGKSIGKQLIGVSGVGLAGIEGKQEAKPLTGRIATGQVGILGKLIAKQLIGVFGAGQAGVLSKLIAKQLIGVSASGQVGILGKSIGKQLIGVSGVGQAGIEGKQEAKLLTGRFATGQTGILGKSISKQLLGVVGSGQIGIEGKLVAKPLSGIAATGRAGLLGLAAQVIGVVATGQAGILRIRIAKPLIGVAAAGKAGNTSVLAGLSRTQALTGVAAIGQTNILGKLITKPLLGRVAAGQVGVVSASISKQLLGRIATGQVGILGKSISKQLIGVSGIGQTGVEGKLVAKPLPGSVATGQVGILGKSISKQLLSVSGTGQVGVEDKLVAKLLLGGIATGQVGVLGKSVSKQLLGVTAIGQAGTEDKLVAKSLLGGTATGQVGILGKTISKQLFGVFGTGQVGTEGKLVSKPLSGLTGIGQVGILGKSIGKQLFGVSGTGQVGAEDKLVVKPLGDTAAAGRVGILGPSISKRLFGVSASGEAGIEGKLVAKPLDGVAGAGQAGITVAVTGQVTRPFGVIAAGQAGILVTFIAKTLDGVEATGQTGIARAQSGEPTVRLTGVVGAGQLGVLETLITKQLTGIAAAGRVGIPSIELASTLLGTAAIGKVGSTVKKVASAFSGTTATGSTSGITARIAIQLGGAVATGRVSSLVAGGELKSSSGVGIAGSISGKIAVPLSKTSASGATGHLGAKISVILTGAVAGIGQVGSMVPTGAVPGGVQGVGGVGNLTAVVSDEHVTIGIGGVQGNGEAGDLPMGKKKRPGGRGAPTRLRPHLFSPPEEFPESPAEAIARWRRIVDDVLEPKEPAIDDVPEEPTEVDVGVVAVAKLHGDELIDDTLDRLRRIAEAEDILLLNDFVQIDEIAGTEAEDLFLLGDLI